MFSGRVIVVKTAYESLFVFSVLPTNKVTATLAELTKVPRTAKKNCQKAIGDQKSNRNEARKRENDKTLIDSGYDSHNQAAKKGHDEWRNEQT